MEFISSNPSTDDMHNPYQTGFGWGKKPQRNLTNKSSRDAALCTKTKFQNTNPHGKKEIKPSRCPYGSI